MDNKTVRRYCLGPSNELVKQSLTIHTLPPISVMYKKSIEKSAGQTPFTLITKKPRQLALKTNNFDPAKFFKRLKREKYKRDIM